MFVQLLIFFFRFIRFRGSASSLIPKIFKYVNEAEYWQTHFHHVDSIKLVSNTEIPIPNNSLVAIIYS